MSSAPVTGAWLTVTLGCGHVFGEWMEKLVRDRNGAMRGESKDIHSSHLSGLDQGVIEGKKELNQNIFLYIQYNKHVDGGDSGGVTIRCSE